MVYCKRCGKKLPENALFCPGCGMTLSGDGTQDETLLPVGTVLNKRYRIEQYLASGGFGNTYKVIDLNLDEAFAVKEFFNRTINNRNPATRVVSANNTTNLVDFKAQLNKFRKEALRMRRIEGDHIVHVHDIFDEHGTCYYVMDFIDGESLSALLKRRGALPEAEVLGYLEQMLLGLDEIHRHSIWHLDLKPGNMMVDRDGKLLLIDFGASKLVDLERGAMTSSMAMAYTPGYAPIEQTEQNIAAIGAPTDLYALGATLYNLLTGEQPPTISELMQGPSAFHFPPEVSPALRELIGNLMQVQKEQRPQNVAQVHHYIDTHYFGPVPAVSTDDATVSAPSPKVVRIYDDDADDTAGNGKKKWWLIAAACAVLALVAGGGWLYRNNAQQQAAMAQQQAQQDSIAAAQAAEQARQDSIAAAEQARQDSIAKWDFFTGAEIKELARNRGMLSASKMKSICQRYGMTLLYEHKSKVVIPSNNEDGEYAPCLTVIGGKGCEYINGRLKPTSDAAFAIELTGTSYDGSTYDCGEMNGFIVFHFPTKEAREKMVQQLKGNGIFDSEKTGELYRNGKINYGATCYYLEQKNGLYCLSLGNLL